MKAEKEEKPRYRISKCTECGEAIVIRRPESAENDVYVHSGECATAKYLRERRNAV